MTEAQIEAYLAPVAQLALRNPGIEGLVFWGDAAGWPDTPTEVLEAEEIAFYAEGLLMEGFHMVWQIVALADQPEPADHIRLLFWQDSAPLPANPAAPWQLLTRADWTPEG